MAAIKGMFFTLAYFQKHWLPLLQFNYIQAATLLQTQTQGPVTTIDFPWRRIEVPKNTREAKEGSCAGPGQGGVHRGSTVSIAFIVVPSFPSLVDHSKRASGSSAQRTRGERAWSGSARPGRHQAAEAEHLPAEDRHGGWAEPSSFLCSHPFYSTAENNVRLPQTCLQNDAETRLPPRGARLRQPR